jgi:hypothetical protein
MWHTATSACSDAFTGVCTVKHPCITQLLLLLILLLLLFSIRAMNAATWLLQNGVGEPPDTTGGSTRGAAAVPARYDQAAMRRLMGKKHETLDDLSARRKKVTHHCSFNSVFVVFSIIY